MQRLSRVRTQIPTHNSSFQHFIYTRAGRWFLDPAYRKRFGRKKCNKKIRRSFFSSHRLFFPVRIYCLLYFIVYSLDGSLAHSPNIPMWRQCNICILYYYYLSRAAVITLLYDVVISIKANNTYGRAIIRLHERKSVAVDVRSAAEVHIYTAYTRGRTNRCEKIELSLPGRGHNNINNISIRTLRNKLEACATGTRNRDTAGNSFPLNLFATAHKRFGCCSKPSRCNT